MSDVIATVSWYLLSLPLALAGGMIGYRFLAKLPDRGLGLSRTIGLLAAGTLTWWGGSSGLLANNRAGNIGAIIIILAFAFWLNRKQLSQYFKWLSDHRGLLILTELIFLLAFGLWAFVRANSPDIVGTEKPMELAFLNAISASESFPPPDPWLAGFGISYYYFGFVIVGMMTQLSGVIPSVAFNLTSAFWFALTIVSAYSLSYNLISSKARRSVLTWPLIGPLLLALSGNVEGFLEVLHGRHLFWQQQADGSLTSAFWRWLDVKTLVDPPMGNLAWIPQRHWWWWRASRVVRDLNLAGVDHEVIDEFPFFSFLLADIHPHVLAIPFALLAVAFAFQLLMSDRPDSGTPLLHLSAAQWRWLSYGINAVTLIILSALVLIPRGTSGQPLLFNPASLLRPLLLAVVILAALNFLLRLFRGMVPIQLKWPELMAGAWIFGSMAFLNTWDFPIYLSLMFFVMLVRERALEWRSRLISAAASGGAILILGVLFFLPWYPSFASQAGGVLPNLGFPTKIQQFFVMFAPLYVPIIVWLLWRNLKSDKLNWKVLLGFAFGLPLFLMLLAGLLAGILSLTLGPNEIGAALDLLGVSSTQLAVGAILSRRVTHSWTALLLGLTIGLAWLLLRPQRSSQAEVAGQSEGSAPSASFTALMIATGALLVLGPEFLYLRDLFGTRMNTIFKFYFASWILWSAAAAYVSYEMRPRSGRQVWRLLIFVPLVLGMFYPVMGIITRTQAFNPGAGRTLDGAAYLRNSNPADAQAIDWINASELSGVVAEAVGGSYSQYGRIATHTPLSTVLGWEFHEVQWRGSAELQGSRKADIERLYSSSDWQEAQQIVDQYGIDYVYIGPLERSSYGAIRSQTFEPFMRLIYQQGEVEIFAVPEKAVLR